MQNFRDLKVWAKAHGVALAIYTVTGPFPDTERSGLASQMRRAAVSVPANIAEGCVRSTDADFARFVHIAMGSASELEYLLLLARDLDYCPEAEYALLSARVEEVKRMLAALLTRLKADS